MQSSIRRNILASGAAMALSACAGPQASPAGAGSSSAARAETDFVLVHGAWHGAWCWRRVAERLQAAGHRVWAPTLSGLCERGHLLSRSITLQTHVEDVVRLVQWEDLQSIVLVGHSYGGMVISGAVETLDKRVRSLVYLDAFLAETGQSVVSMFPPAVKERLDKAVAASEGFSLPPFPAAAFVGQDSPDIAWVTSMMTPQPYATFAAQQGTTAVRTAHARKTYVRARRFSSVAFDGAVERIRDRPDWRLIDLPDHQHDLMVTAPDLTVRILLEAAA